MIGNYLTEKDGKAIAEILKNMTLGIEKIERQLDVAEKNIQILYKRTEELKDGLNGRSLQ